MSLGHFAWLTPWRWGIKIFRAAPERGVLFSGERVETLLKPVAYRALRSPSLATRPNTNTFTRSGDRGRGGSAQNWKSSDFLELIDSIVVAVPADYTRYV